MHESCGNGITFWNNFWHLGPIARIGNSWWYPSKWIGEPFFIRKELFKFRNFSSADFKKNFDESLIIGSTLFSIGWGLTGLCPGPIVASVSLDPERMLVFIIILMGGIWGGRRIRFFLTQV